MENGETAARTATYSAPVTSNDVQQAKDAAVPERTSNS